jgi:hypothetical protein
MFRYELISPISPAILSLWYSRFEVTWLLRDDCNSKTRPAEWKQISKVCHLVIAVFSLWVQSHNFWEIKFGYVLPEVLHGDFFIWNKIFSQPTVKYFTNINQNFFFLLLITPIEMNCHSKFSSFSPNTCFEVKISQSENIAMTRWRDLLIWRHLLW